MNAEAQLRERGLELPEVSNAERSGLGEGHYVLAYLPSDLNIARSRW